MKDLVLGQAKINENLTKKMLSHDKILENINSKIEHLSSSMKNQLCFNKMLETQLAQIAAAVPVTETGRIPGQPETPLESVNMISSRLGKPHNNRSSSFASAFLGAEGSTSSI